MDSFGFDFAGGDLLDLGSLGNWGTTPLDSSPSNGNLPFSVGTPTGVQSLGGESGFTTLHVGEDFGFIDSPKATGVSTSTSVTTSSTTSTTTAQTTKSEDFFSSSLEPDHGNTTSATPSTSLDTKPKSEESSVKEGNTESTTTNTANEEDATGLGSFIDGSSKSSSSGNDMNLSNAFQNKTSTPDASNTSSKPSSTSSTTSTPPPSSSNANTSSARPHIDTTTPTGPPGPSGMAPATHPSSQMQQLQPQPRYGTTQPNMMMGGPPPPQPSTGYNMSMNVGQPMMNGQPQFMQPTPPQQYRPSTSTYDEEMMRVKSMMMQHPDLIPPPLEVLRISMAQGGGQAMLGMMGGNNNPNAYLHRANSMPNRIGTGPNYGTYGGPNPNMMMPGQPNQPSMMDPRMRVMQQQMNQPRTSMSPQARVSVGGPEGIPVAWQSESDLPLRRKMIGKIVSLLQQRKPDAPAEWIRRLPDMARRLEDSLYRTAKNRDEYGDFTSLKTRLQHLAVTMGARAQHKGVANARPGGPPAGNGPGPNMMGPGGNGMGMNVGMPSGMPQGVAPMPMGVNGIPYGNPPNRMTPQQAQMLQQQQMQMQMQTRQFSPQQMQQYQAAQRHRHFQMQQQAQMHRQNSSQQFQQQQQAAAAAGLQRQNSIQRQHSGGQPGQQPPNLQQQMQMQQQMHQQLQQRQQNPNYMQPMQGGSSAGQQGAQAGAQLQRRNSINSNPTAPNGNTNPSNNANTIANARRPNSDISGGLDSNDFLDLDLTQTFMGNDLESTLNSNHPSGSDTSNSTGLKRTQQQLAAEANAAAFKRMKGSGPSPNQRGSSPRSPQKPGGSKTPSMSAVNAK